MKSSPISFLIVLILASVSCDKSGTPPPRATDIASALESPNAVVVDVRSPAEYSEGHVPGAVNIPVDAVSAEIESVVTDKTAAIVVHCAAGARSARAAIALKKMGYQNIIDAKTPTAVAEAAGLSLTKTGAVKWPLRSRSSSSSRPGFRSQPGVDFGSGPVAPARG